jgi:hypothetical protein
LFVFIICLHFVSFVPNVASVSGMSFFFIVPSVFSNGYLSNYEKH